MTPFADVASSASLCLLCLSLSVTNGLRAPTQPSASNGGVTIFYSYFISDGATYTVVGNLTLTTSSAFATNKDSLGNPYQTIVSVTGTRTYTYLPNNTVLTSTVSGVSTAAYPSADARFYPYALLSSSPGVYTLNTAPLWDYEGLEFAVSPSIPQLGRYPGSGTQYNATSLYYNAPETTAVLVDGYYVTLPLVALQQQTYSFQ